MICVFLARMTSSDEAVSVITLSETLSTEGIRACKLSNIKSCTRAAINVEALLSAPKIVFPDTTEMVRVKELDMSKSCRRFGGLMPL